MPFTRIDDGFLDEVERAGLSKEAERLHVRALVICNKVLSDGELNEHNLKRITIGFRNVPKLLDELVEKFGWERVERTEHGRKVTVFLLPWDHQFSADSVTRERALAAARQTKFREKGLVIREERAGLRDSEEGESNGVTNGVSHGALSNPVQSNTSPDRAKPPKGYGEGKDKDESKQNLRRGSRPRRSPSENLLVQDQGGGVAFTISRIPEEG
ncbi:RepA-like replication initiator [Rhodococcus phage Jflix2]|nr:RepA-like replication initiator [Rhodococcus phage Jflix2]